MNDFLITNRDQLIQSGIVLGVLVLLRIALRQTVKRIGRLSGYNERRVAQMGKYFNFLFLLIALGIAFIIWGVNLESIAVIFSSVFAIVGIALFAVWSILSNVTSGIIMFFSFPYRIGDKIKIHDKDHPIEAIIQDIRAFHIHLLTDEGEFITYPNNLILQKAVSIIQKNAYQE